MRGVMKIGVRSGVRGFVVIGVKIVGRGWGGKL